MALADEVARALDAHDSVTRLEACRKLSEGPSDLLKSDAVTSFVVALLKDSSWKVRVAALHLLTWLPVEIQVAHASLVVAMLKHMHPLVRQAACETFGRLPSAVLRRHGSALADVLKDNEYAVRDAALATLAELPADVQIAIADTLAVLLTDSAALVRTCACLALGSFPAVAWMADAHLADEAEAARLVKLDKRCGDLLARKPRADVQTMPALAHAFSQEDHASVIDNEMEEQRTQSICENVTLSLGDDAPHCESNDEIPEPSILQVPAAETSAVLEPSNTDHISVLAAWWAVWIRLVLSFLCRVVVETCQKSGTSNCNGKITVNFANRYAPVDAASMERRHEFQRYACVAS